MFRRRRSTRALLAEALTRTRTTAARLNGMIQRVDARRRYLEEKVVEHMRAGRQDLAKRYAVEAAQMRRLLRELSYIEAAVEALANRIETAMHVQDAGVILGSALGVVNELKNTSVAAIPEVAIGLNGIEEALRGALESTGMPSLPSPQAPTVLDEDARKILEEARIVAEHKGSS